jgi:hypothetical protein
MELKHDREEDILAIETTPEGAVDHAEHTGPFIEHFEAAGRPAILGFSTRAMRELRWSRQPPRALLNRCRPAPDPCTAYILRPVRPCSEHALCALSMLITDHRSLVLPLSLPLCGSDLSPTTDY